MWVWQKLHNAKNHVNLQSAIFVGKSLELFISFYGIELESNDPKYLNPLIILHKTDV